MTSYVFDSLNSGAGPSRGYMTKVSFDDQFRAAALIFLAELIKRAEEVIFPLGRASPAPLFRPCCHFCQLIGLSLLSR